MERVLITGGTGFLGGATVRRLLDAGYAVRVLTRGSWPFPAHPRLERANGSMTNAQSLREAVRECDAVVHLAARKNDERDSEAVNVDGTRTLCEAAKRAGVTRFVYVSTQSAALPRRGAYGDTKLRGEGAVRSSGVPFVILRPSLVYGEGDAGVFATIEKLSTLPFVPVFGDGQAVFRPIHVDDAADAIVAGLRKEEALGATLDIGGPDAITFDELIRRVQASRGSRSPVAHLPAWLGLLGASLLRALPRPPVTRSNVLGGLASTPMDVATANRILGIEPREFAIARRETDDLAAAYISYVSARRVEPTPELCARFRAACAAHGVEPPRAPRVLVPYLDAASRLRDPTCALRTTLVIAAAVAECTPQGALAYLPRSARMTSLVLGTLLAGVAGAWFAAVGLLLWSAIPSFRRHAR